jgi:hypothetical protein
MMLTITEHQMVLHADGVALAGAARRPDGKWDVSTWPTPLGRDQAITGHSTPPPPKRAQIQLCPCPPNGLLPSARRPPGERRPSGGPLHPGRVKIAA